MKTPVFSSPAARSSPRRAAVRFAYSRTSSFPIRSTSGCSGADDEERRAEQRVRPRREDRDVDVQLLQPEQDLGALGASDPVALDRLRALGPRAALGQVVAQQLVRVRGDLEEPLLQVPRLDQRAAAVAAAVDDVLVRHDRLVVRAPVHRRPLSVRQAALEEPQEQPLRPPVVRGVVGRDLAIPVDHPAEPAHLRTDGGDVPLDDLARVTSLPDRRVLGRQPEGVPTHRAQHVPPTPAANVGDDVAHRVVEDVPHVQRPGGVRQHLQLVPVRARRASSGGGFGVEKARSSSQTRCHFASIVCGSYLSMGHKKASRGRGRGKLTAASAAFASWPTPEKLASSLLTIPARHSGETPRKESDGGVQVVKVWEVPDQGEDSATTRSSSRYGPMRNDLGCRRTVASASPLRRGTCGREGHRHRRRLFSLLRPPRRVGDNEVVDPGAVDRDPRVAHPKRRVRCGSWR